MEAAGELGSVGVIIVPAFKSSATRIFLIRRKPLIFFVNNLMKWVKFARAKHHTTVIFEPLNRREAFYLRQVRMLLLFAVILIIRECVVWKTSGT